MTKQIDVGFVRTDQLERYIDRQTGNLLDLSLIKVIQPQTDVVMSNGLIFPFPMSSTFLYPEWPLAAMPHVDRRLVKDVQKTLLKMAGAADQKQDESAAIITDAFTLGKFAGWSPALSYLELRNLQNELGILDENNHCITGTEIKDAIVCKPGYYRRGDDELDKQCALEGLDCYGFDCICKPCVARPPVEFAPLDQTDHSCSKFDVCGKVEQGEKIQFVLKDNLLRTNATIVIDVVFDKESTTHELDQMEEIPYQYIFEFDSRNRMVDVAILDIYVDGEQINLSPVRLDIIERNCIAATGSPRRIADAFGNCICDRTAIAFGSSFCLPNGVIVAISLGPVLLFLSYFAWRYIVEKHRETNFWVIENEDLMFEADVRLLGRGSFGCVLEASYRGSLVAVKRAMPPTDSQCKSNLSEIQNIFKQASFNFRCERSSDILPRNEAPAQHSQNLSSTLLQTSRSRKAFREEMQRMAALRHPCITTLFGAVLNKTAEPMLVMEHMELGSLRDLIRNVTLVLESETILSILLDAISGLKFLHAAEPVILHKDLKSTNILIDSKYRAKISDFGLSKMQDLDHLKAIGSLSYVAPELIQDEATHSTASDVFAFGVVMTEVLFGKIPYEDEHMHIILDSEDDRSTDQRLNIPDDADSSVAKLVEDCLSVQPSARPSSNAIEARLKLFQHAYPSQALLYQIFPKHIADDLRNGKKTGPERFDMVTGAFWCCFYVLDLTTFPFKSLL